MSLRHEHLLVRAELHEAIKDTKAVEAWISDLIQAIGMETLKGPFSIYSTMPGNTGVTAGAILSTSHTMLHTFEEEDHTVLQLDVYSCAAICIETITARINEFFKPYLLEYKFLDRDKAFTIL